MVALLLCILLIRCDLLLFSNKSDPCSEQIKPISYVVVINDLLLLMPLLATVAGSCGCCAELAWPDQVDLRGENLALITLQTNPQMFHAF